jgi:hypothetical protein
MNICDVAWPKANLLFSCDSWNRNDVLLERRVSKADYQDLYQVSWDKVLKKNTPYVLVVQQPQQSTLRNELEYCFLDRSTERSPVILVFDDKSVLTAQKGGRYKQWCRRISQRGYATTTE